ncbi:MAG TPA: ornithine carbamoyltransferase [Thermoanaerobaculia bacterium]|jgi:ornithine carbamoyltransferase|nr:ornithine carbamoyltransferase [Thermoanaerobaculia bacterium]
MPRHLISIHDLTAAEVAGLYRLAADVKAHPGKYADHLHRKTLGMIFEKSSTRTRVSFEVGMAQMGGHALFLSSRDIQLGRGEPISDTAQVLSRYVDGIMARTFAHQTVLDLARYGSVPVINGLTDDLHPCQVLADYFTLAEVFGGLEALRGRKLAYIGDGNNMAHSLMFGAAKVGMDIAIASPKGYEVKPQYAALARQDAGEAGTKIILTNDPAEAVEGASCVETDVWASMGQEAEAQERLKAFRGFMVDSALMARARQDAVFLHCLPAHRGEEVAAEVADGSQSRIFDEAENRLHVQKAVMLWLMAEVDLGSL